MNALLVKNGLVISAQGRQPRDLLIQDGSIVRVAPGFEPSSDLTVIDARGKWIFPGVIDPHTHMGIPIKSGESADTFASGSRSALHGGVTTILDFSVLGPQQSLRQSLDERMDLAKESVCDVGIHVNITRFEAELLTEIPELIASGFNSFKVFTTYAEAKMMLTYPQIEEVARVIAKYNGILMVHSEDNAVIEGASRRYSNREQTHPRFHGLSRPAEAELAAVSRLGEISQRTKCRIYIVHLNTAAGLARAAEFPMLKVETCPHYLLLTEEMYQRSDGRMFVASPPLRTEADLEALWQGIQDGHVHTLGSDHCPFCLADKPTDIPFQGIPNGMGGVETLFPTLLPEFIERDIDLEILVRLTSQNPADIFGIDHMKGRLEPGLHADLLIVDPSAMSRGWESTLETELDWNAYTEFPGIFPEMVIRRGEVVVEAGSLKAPEPGIILRSK